MAWPRPRSLLHLLLAAFVFVTLPLLTAIYQAGLSFDDLTHQSRNMVFTGIQATRLSQRSRELLLDMERRARQYHILGKADLLALYRADHTEFLGVLTQLRSLLRQADQQRRLNDLRDGAEAVVATLAGEPFDSEVVRKSIERFSRMGDLAAVTAEDSGALVDAELNSLQAAVERTQNTLVFRSLALVPVTLLLISLFTFLINRPIHQLDQAIRRLGTGHFDRSIAVAGPRDLEFLGERLDWLRLRLNSLEQEKNQFLRRMSHELKTPLSSLREGAELLADRVAGPLSPEQTEVVDILDANSRNLQKLIENLLDFNLIQKGAQLQVASLDLSELVAEVVAGHRLTATSKLLRFQLPEQALDLEGDRAKLRTALDNLISNAVSFSPQGGWIRITGSKDSQGVALEVADQGPGIPEAERGKVFDPFFQGSTPRKGHLKGSGIGLSIARECVLAHGGKLDIVDRASGACFRLELPFHPFKEHA
ncbi:Histidine kinase [Sulfidibacter corallicola]|uniref:histidine kinase n=1 Tax=Sulfidibacter corallicola TaxID=2818388 RepID=A0A8A4TJ54_SULCO|nr:ATP-binding protein [Sulfidibacter corallicola]QTD49182.1 hypothetical protein J3U87_26650 [Sulfidibacter corallicola]